jgi:methionyl-tRNA formyltransferase
VDYGVIISKKVIDFFDKGIINSHFSLLPEWRGADPITYSLLSGQNKTGVSLMLINEKLDDGPIIAQAIIPITNLNTNKSLTDSLISASNELLKTYTPLYLNGQIISTPQINQLETYSRKIDKKDGYINFDKPAPVLEREIKAFNTWPKSHCKIGALEVVITSASTKKGSTPVGEWIIDGNRLFVGCRASVLEILELKPIGKNTMPAESFINGYGNRFLAN